MKRFGKKISRLDGRRPQALPLRSPIRGTATSGPVAIHYPRPGRLHRARYDETMEVFTRHGEWPASPPICSGHGRSEGVRGRVHPGFRDWSIASRESNEAGRSAASCAPEERGPLGILGHSAGGLMALREIAPPARLPIPVFVDQLPSHPARSQAISLSWFAFAPCWPMSPG